MVVAGVVVGVGVVVGEVGVEGGVGVGVVGAADGVVVEVGPWVRRRHLQRVVHFVVGRWGSVYMGHNTSGLLPRIMI